MKVSYRRLNRYLLFFFLLMNASSAQTVLLPERWHFITADSAAYIDPQFNDSSWTLLDVPSWWNNLGIAWYRLHFTLEKPLRGDSAYVVLGKIDDADETYLNGVRIGGMGKFPPNPVTAYDTPRAYKIPTTLLQAVNVLAVRVYNMIGPGGIVFGPIGIYDERDYERRLNPPRGPKASFHQLVTSNGLIAAVYNEQRAFIEEVLPNIFQAYDSANVVKPVLRRIAVTSKARTIKTFYKNNTHVITVVYPDFEVNYFAPFTTEEKVLYVVVSGTRPEVAHCSLTYETQHAEVLVDSVLFERSNDKAEKYFMFSFVDSLQTNRDIIKKAKAELRADNGRLLHNEVEFMEKIFARAHIPKNISSEQRALLEQSISVLKMAQVPPQEVFPKSAGQILASLPPGGWNIAWVRDGCYSILGLNRLGLFDEARRALSFMLNAESDHYVHHVYKDGRDYGVGVPYQISVCRYFGTGKEESDYSDDGPNIELDGFGFSLFAVCDYVRRSGDTVFFKQNYHELATKVADAIIHCIDTNNLIRMESGPWERHLPGKQFAYTSIVCAAGLRDFSALSSQLHLGDAGKYHSAYERLFDGIRTNLVVHDEFIKANVPASDSNAHDYFDGGTFEAFTLGLFSDTTFFHSQLLRYSRALGVSGGIHGFSRINNGDWYETSEWILLDLRAASAMCSYGDREGARRLIQWVTDQAALNFNLLPELYDAKTSFYDGAVPMVGFGAGAYAIALSDVYN
jgi:GH15 family glucan-1,4-alpha-glucosidase